MNKKGNPLGPNEAIHFACGITAIILERRNGTVMFCFINTSRYPLVKDYRWHVHGGKGRPFYAETGWRTSDGGKTLEMQRLLTGRQFEEVDHIDGNGLCPLRSYAVSLGGDMHLSRLGDDKFVNGRHVREYVPKSAEEEIEEIRARIAQNNKAAARQGNKEQDPQ